MILGGQFVSRINMNLREDKGYTYGARTAFEFRRAPGPFVLHASVQADATADALREAIGEIRAIRGERPVTREELELGRASLTRGYPRSFETADQIARGAAQLALYDLPDDYFTTFVPKVLSLTEPEVTAIAARHINPARLLTVVVGDREKLTPSLKRSTSVTSRRQRGSGLIGSDIRRSSSSVTLPSSVSRTCIVDRPSQTTSAKYGGAVVEGARRLDQPAGRRG